MNDKQLCFTLAHGGRKKGERENERDKNAKKLKKNSVKNFEGEELNYLSDKKEMERGGRGERLGIRKGRA